MKRILGIILAVSTVVVAMPAVQAATFTVQGSSIQRNCFVAVPIAATIEVTTNGRLLQKQQAVQIGNFAPGSQVEFTQSPAVYFQTQKVVEPQHISLVPTNCY